MRKARAGRDRLRDREVAKSIERRRLGQPQRCALDSMLAREDAIAEKEGRKPDYRSQTIMSEVCCRVVWNEGVLTVCSCLAILLLDTRQHQLF